MSKKKHTIEECRLKYESSNEFDLKQIAEWSGYTYGHIKNVCSRNNWQKGVKLLTMTEKALKKQSEDYTKKLLETKELLDKGSIDNAKVAINALLDIHNDEDARPFEKLKCSRIFEEIVEKIKANLGINSAIDDKSKSKIDLINDLTKIDSGKVKRLYEDD